MRFFLLDFDDVIPLDRCIQSINPGPFVGTHLSIPYMLYQVDKDFRELADKQSDQRWLEAWGSTFMEITTCQMFWYDLFNFKLFYVQANNPTSVFVEGRKVTRNGRQKDVYRSIRDTLFLQLAERVFGSKENIDDDAETALRRVKCLRGSVCRFADAIERLAVLSKGSIPPSHESAAQLKSPFVPFVRQNDMLFMKYAVPLGQAGTFKIFEQPPRMIPVSAFGLGVRYYQITIDYTGNLPKNSGIFYKIRPVSSPRTKYFTLTGKP